MDLAYRSLDHVAAERFEALTVNRAERIAALGPLRTVYARRVARSVAGLAATVLGATLFALTYGGAVFELFMGHTGRKPHGELTRLMLFAWAASLVLYVVARPIARAYVDARLATPIARTGDVLGGVVPGALLFAIPPVLVFLTGLVFVPAAYLRMTSRVIRERIAIEHANANAPA
jgi:hypothetical protein